MAMSGYRAPAAPKVSTSFQTQRQTTGYREPFPSLSGAAQRAPSQPPLRTDASSSGPGYGTRPARPPMMQQPQVNPQATAQNQQAPMTPQVGYSFDADPILNQIQALSGQSRQDAETNAHALRLQLAQQYGDENLARQYGGESEAAAAKGNPNSVLAQLAHSYELGQSGLEQALNQQNLYYSGARVKQLAELAQQYQSQQAGAAGQEQDALGGISSNLAAALHAADLRDIQAQQDAQNRALQAALGAGGTGLPGGGVDSGGGGVDTGGDMFAPPPAPFATPNLITQIANAIPQVPSAPATPWDQIIQQLVKPPAPVPYRGPH